MLLVEYSAHIWKGCRTEESIPSTKRDTPNGDLIKSHKKKETCRCNPCGMRFLYRVTLKDFVG